MTVRAEADWDGTIAVNLKGVFNWCQAVAPAMVAQRSGRIVNISSVSAHTGAGFAICPGTVFTDLTARTIEAKREAILRSIPLGRLGTPEDIAEVVAFLATVTPNFITGEVVDVDGGQWVN